jgi:hypothetical protein
MHSLIRLRRRVRRGVRMRMVVCVRMRMIVMVIVPMVMVVMIVRVVRSHEVFLQMRESQCS